MRTSDGVTTECERFIAELHPRLVGGLTLQCGDRALAEELAQETLVRVWDRWAVVASADSPEAWAWRVALNLSASWFRRRGAERRATGRLAVVPQREPSSDAADRLAVREAVAALPARQRAVLVLRYFDDLGVSDAAAALGCAPGTVKSLTHKAIAGLRERLGIELEVATDEDASGAAKTPNVEDDHG
jgi:RNA polymerase sigma-70 factor (sigma-E family)